VLATRINDHVSAALERFMQQYEDVALTYTLTLHDGSTLAVSAIGAILATQVDEAQELEDAIYALDHGRQFFDGVTFPASGAQLDGIGELVGIARNGLTDAEYLIFILGTIAENNSDTTVAAIVNIASLLFQVTVGLLAYEMPPAEFNLQFPDTTPLQAYLWPVAANIIHNALGAGISLGFISLYPAATPTSPFRFSSVSTPSPGGGFSSIAQPTVGGGFARNIYHSVGV
jgi:hypothetical protein